MKRSDTGGSDSHKPDADEALTARLRTLPREIEPRADLWAELQADLMRDRPARRSFSRRGGLATAALVLLTSGWLAFNFLPGSEPVDAPESVIAAVAAPTDTLAAPELVALRRSAYERFAVGVDALAPETRAVIEANLERIAQARKDIEAAIAADPNSELLRRLWLSNTTQELTFLREVDDLTQRRILL